MSKLTKNSSDPFSSPRIEEDLFVPLLMILTLVAVINTCQAYAYFYKGPHDFWNFIRLFVSKFIYCLFFGVFAYVTRWLSQKIKLSASTMIRWLCIHLVTLVSLVIIHQGLSLGVDTFLLALQTKTSIMDVFLRNTLVWLDIVVYIFFVIVFQLLQNRLINEENEYTFFQMEVALMNSPLHELRSKIHPKFLFNTLHTILLLIQEHRNVDANKVLSLFSNFLRATVYDIEQDEISLEAEKRLLLEYLEIEKVRFRNELEVFTFIPDECLAALVPNYLLQPIVEELLNNADDIPDAKKTIKISAERRKNDLCITLEDNFTNILFANRDPEANESKLMISKKRLFQLFKDDQSIDIIRGKDRGTIIRISIPHHTRQDNLEIKYAGAKKYEY